MRLVWMVGIFATLTLLVLTVDVLVGDDLRWTTGLVIGALATSWLGDLQDWIDGRFR